MNTQRVNYVLVALGLLLSLVAQAVMLAPKASAFSGTGAGTSMSPYLISSCAQFSEIGDEPEAQYALTTSLDCTASGNNIMSDSFEGSLEGNNHTLTIDLYSDDMDELALFMDLEGDIMNLNLAGSVVHEDGESNATAVLATTADGASIDNVHSTVDVTGGYRTGGLFGTFVRGNVDASSVRAAISGGPVTGGVFGYTGCAAIVTGLTYEGDVTGSQNVGGIAGEDGCEGPASSFEEVIVENSSITSPGQVVGGIIGYAGGTEISNSSAKNITLTAAGDAGGIFGSIRHGGSVYRVFATGSVTSSGSNVGGIAGYVSGGVDLSEAFTNVVIETDTDDAGGLIGELENGSVADSYARGSVHATNGYAGGLVGYGSEDSNISRSYSTGAVNDGGESGGLTGSDNSLTSDDSFWDIQTSGWETSEHGTGKTTAEMKNVTTFTSLSTDGLEYPWDFVGNPGQDEDNDDLWDISAGYNAGYPCLTWTTASCGVGDEGGAGEDLNGDNIPDTEQPNVSGYTSAITGKTVVIDVGEDCEITTDNLVSESSFQAQDPGFNYDNGLFDFAADCGDPGYTTTIKLYFYDVNINGLVVRKHNPVTNAYFNLTDTYGATLTQTTINGQNVAVASYQITDGGVLDVDGEANGQIVDPVGLAVGAVASPDTGLGRR